ncbi:hypothetical protein [Bosea sp. 117]|uniref:hypothetical protein n=1 Tax=Bosea sp. 117 TaxID=1125973 RepID=UPI000494996F|nr:hypothetical protein [Bosea sp. 117]
MNTANLQMEGTLLALAALTEVLARKGILSAEDLTEALGCAERGASARSSGLSEANKEAIRFPIRFLRHALQQRDGAALDYAAIAAGVGRTRERVKL